jgi:hypothetical protein
MLTEDERERLELIETLFYATRGQSIHLVELCERWPASGNPVQEARVCYLLGNSNRALFVNHQVLLAA